MTAWLSGRDDFAIIVKLERMRIRRLLGDGIGTPTERETLDRLDDALSNLVSLYCDLEEAGELANRNLRWERPHSPEFVQQALRVYMSGLLWPEPVERLEVILRKAGVRLNSRSPRSYIAQKLFYMPDMSWHKRDGAIPKGWRMYRKNMQTHFLGEFR